MKWQESFMARFVIYYEKNNKVKKDDFQTYGGHLSKRIYNYWKNHHSEKKEFLYMKIYFPIKTKKCLIYSKQQLEDNSFWKEPVTLL